MTNPTNAPESAGVPDQRSVTDQLGDLKRIAIDRGMYDAADWISNARCGNWPTPTAPQPETPCPNDGPSADPSITHTTCSLCAPETPKPEEGEGEIGDWMIDDLHPGCYAAMQARDGSKWCNRCESAVVFLSGRWSSPAPEPESAEVGRLLPCPFCGGSDLDTDYGYNRVYVRCNNPKCYADGPITGETRETGTAAWNLRSHPTPEREDGRAEAHRTFDEWIDALGQLNKAEGDDDTDAALVRVDAAFDAMKFAAHVAADAAIVTAAKGGRS